MVVTGLRGFIEVMMHAIWLLFVVALSHMFEGSAHVVISTAHMDEYVCSLATVFHTQLMVWFGHRYSPQHNRVM